MSRYDVRGKVAIITGAASGFGEGLAWRLAEQGAKVVLGDTNNAGHQLAKMINDKMGLKAAVFAICNVTVSTDMKNLFDLAKASFGRVDIFVGNAGIPERRLFAEDVDDTWHTVVAVDLIAVVQGTRMAITEFKKAGKPGVIVNTASMAGLIPVPEMPVYSAAKGGLVHFTRSLGRLNSQLGIRVNCVCPGGAATNIFNHPLEKVMDDGTVVRLERSKISHGSWLSIGQ
ncbi:hypothetical protein HDU93_004607, partial [Gonapodya sp. JEL0774]